MDGDPRADKRDVITEAFALAEAVEVEPRGAGERALDGDVGAFAKLEALGNVEGDDDAGIRRFFAALIDVDRAHDADFHAADADVVAEAQAADVVG